MDLQINQPLRRVPTEDAEQVDGTPPVRVGVATPHGGFASLLDRHAKRDPATTATGPKFMTIGGTTGLDELTTLRWNVWKVLGGR
jgi:hypothetical protein